MSHEKKNNRVVKHFNAAKYRFPFFFLILYIYFHFLCGFDFDEEFGKIKRLKSETIFRIVF